MQKQIDDIKTAADNKKSAIAWQIVNKITGKKTTNRSKIKAKYDKERIQKWKQHFSLLLEKNPITTNQDIVQIVEKELKIEQGPFTIEELEMVLRKTKKNKTAGLDEIPAEVWKTGHFNHILLEFCNDVYSQKPIEHWTKACILPFPKKADLTVTDNYRGITLTCIADKIHNTLLRERIQLTLNMILRQYQNGFRNNRSTAGQIITVRRIIEGVKEKNLVASLIFVDFSKDFDSIHRAKMALILKSYGIPMKIINAIMILYRDTKSIVRSPDGDTEYFDINAGVLQGVTLAPLLFIIILNYVLRTSIDENKYLSLTLSKQRSRRYPTIKITDAYYADDLVIFADSSRNAEKLLNVLEESGKIVGLKVNIKNTYFFACAIHEIKR